MSSFTQSVFAALSLVLLACVPQSFGQEKQITTTSEVKMVLIPASADGKIGAFYMDVHEVSQTHFEKLTGMNPAKFTGKGLPVERIRWFEAIEYCNARSKKEGLEACYNLKTGECDFAKNGYRLPTEAEWEHACLGNKPPIAVNRLSEVAWFRGNANETVHPSGQKKPNGFGLYDMQGNLWEWCQDVYSDNSGKLKRALRGGSWDSEAKECLPSSRTGDMPASPDICQGYPFYGFRCVRKIG